MDSVARRAPERFPEGLSEDETTDLGHDHAERFGLLRRSGWAWAWTPSPLAPEQSTLQLSWWEPPDSFETRPIPLHQEPLNKSGVGYSLAFFGRILYPGHLGWRPPTALSLVHNVAEQLGIDLRTVVAQRHDSTIHVLMSWLPQGAPQWSIPPQTADPDWPALQETYEFLRGIERKIRRGGQRRLEHKPDHPWRIMADQAIALRRENPFITLDEMVGRLGIADEEGKDRTKTLGRWITLRLEEIGGN